MPKGIPNKRYTGEFKQEVVETMLREKLSYKEIARLYDISGHDRVRQWERIYLEEGPEGLYIERRGRGSKGRPAKKLTPEVEEDLLAEVYYWFPLFHSNSINADSNAQRPIGCIRQKKMGA